MTTKIPAASSGHDLTFGLETGEPLIDHFNRHMVAAMQTLAELPRPGTHLVLGVVHIQRQANHHQVRAPLLEQGFNLLPVRDTVPGGYQRHRLPGTQ